MAAADAQYVIDIAAQMGGGERTLAELDALSANLTSAGKNADHFQQAIKKLSGDLDVARAAQQAANAALGAGRDKFGELERAAVQASKAAERAAAKNGGVVPPDLKAKADAANAAVDGYAASLRELEQSAERAGAEEAQLAQALANTRKLSGHVDRSLAGQSESLSKLQGALGQVGGPLGALGQKVVGPVKGFSELTQTMGASRAAALLGAVAFAAVAAAIVAVGVAALAGAAKIAQWAVSLADSRREAELATEAFNAANPALAGLPFSELTRDTGLASKQLQGLAKSIAGIEDASGKAVVSAEDLPAALRAAALAERALGQGGAQDFIASLKDAKGGVAALAVETQAKFGGIVEKQMLGLEAQSGRLRSNISDIFGGLNIDPVLEGMQTLVALFDKNTAAGAAMKFLFEEIFQPIIDQAKNAAYIVEAFWLGFLIGATKIYIALKPVIKAVSEFFGFEDTALTDLLGVAKNAGEFLAYALVGLVAVFGTLAVAFSVAAAAAAAFVAGIIALPVLVGEAISAVAGLIMSGITSAIDFLRGLDMGQIGMDLITGLAAGITAGAGAVLSAITGAVQGAIGAAKSLLGIASPSKVFEEIGAYTGEGFVGGVEAENDNAQAALSEMVSPESAVAAVSSPTDGAAAAGGAAASEAASAAAMSGGGSTAITIEAGAFVFQGVKDAEHADALFRESLRRVLAGEAAATGPTGAEVAA